MTKHKLLLTIETNVPDYMLKSKQFWASLLKKGKENSGLRLNIKKIELQEPPAPPELYEDTPF